jgi:hypothetical protein
MVLIMSEITINREALVFNLLQARGEIDIFVKECRAGKYDGSSPLVVAQRFAVVMNYLCNAWHHRTLTGEAIKQLSQEDYEKYSTLIPNFCFKFRFDEAFDQSPGKEN